VSRERKPATRYDGDGGDDDDDDDGDKYNKNHNMETISGKLSVGSVH
jgi:hypothetical protein